MTKLHSKLNEKLEKLFEDNYGLLVSQAISFRPKNQSELDEYIQVAAIGMMKAYENYDEERSKFSTFAIVCIRNSLKNHIRKESKPRPITADLEWWPVKEELHLEDILPDDITDVEFIIIIMKLEGYTYKEISDTIRIPILRVKNKLYNTYRKIRKANEV